MLPEYCFFIAGRIFLTGRSIIIFCECRLSPETKGHATDRKSQLKNYVSSSWLRWIVPNGGQAILRVSRDFLNIRHKKMDTVLFR